MYWVDSGRALARLRGRREDAVLALRRAELISPHRVLRDPVTREVIAELLGRVRRESRAGWELQGMAYRAGLLPVQTVWVGAESPSESGARGPLGAESPWGA